MKLNHLHLHVVDLPACTAFYTDIFGFQTKAKFGESLVFLTDGEGFDFALMADDSPGPVPSWLHFGFRFEELDALEAAWSKIESAEVVVIRPKTNHGSYVDFRIQDPQGYVLECYWDPELSE